MQQPHTRFYRGLPERVAPRRRWVVAGAAVVGALAVVAVVQGVLGSSPSPHPLSVAQTERTFAASGLPIVSAPGALLEVSGGFHPSAILGYAPDGNFSSSGRAVFVVVYPNIQDASDASRAAPTLLGGSLSHEQAKNVLVLWRGGQNPSVATAISRLR